MPEKYLREFGRLGPNPHPAQRDNPVRDKIKWRTGAGRDWRLPHAGYYWNAVLVGPMGRGTRDSQLLMCFERQFIGRISSGVWQLDWNRPRGHARPARGRL